MHPQKTSLFAVVLLVLTFLSADLFAQSSQYKRSPKKSKKSAAKKGGGKVDISGLEEKYWTQKDTEFKVVQNRLYSKKNRFGVSLGLGPIVNDGFSVGNVINGGLSYYFDERHGVELVYSHYAMSQSKMTSNFINEFEAVPDYNELNSFYGVQYHWVPIYAKLSLLDYQILYFDFVISPGVGLVNYTQKINEEDGDDRSGSSPVISLDVTQKIYVHKNMSINVGLHNRYLISEEIRDASRPEETKTDTQISTSLSVGATFFFGGFSEKGDEKKEGAK